MNNIQINDSDVVSVSISDSLQYLIQKVPIYSEGTLQFGDIPIAYEIVLKESTQKEVEKEESNYLRKKLKGSDCACQKKK